MFHLRRWRRADRAKGFEVQKPRHFNRHFALQAVLLKLWLHLVLVCALPPYPSFTARSAETT